MPPIKFGLLEYEYSGYVATPSKFEVVIKDQATPKLAVAGLRKAAPPSDLKCVFVIAKDYFSQRRLMVESLREAGYTDIEAIEHPCASNSAAIRGVPLKCNIGEPLFVVRNAQYGVPLEHCLIDVIQKCDKGYRIAKIGLTLIEAASSWEYKTSVRNVVAYKYMNDDEKEQLKMHFEGKRIHYTKMTDCRLDFMWNRFRGGDLDGCEVLPFCDVDVELKFANTNERIVLTQQVPPFTVKKEVDVGHARKIIAYAVCEMDDTHPSEEIKKFKFKSAGYRKVLVTVSVDKTHLPEVTVTEIEKRDLSIVPAEQANPKDVSTVELVPTLAESLEQVKLNSTPTTILTLTSDNYVLIDTKEGYTGVKKLPAYVRLQCGKVPEFGKSAFAARQTDPASVIYDITRLLATDFDPDHPDPSWDFKTTRDADGKVIVHAGDNITTFPIVLFGLIVKSTLLYIGEHLNAELDSVEVRMPLGTFISDTDLKGISERIGTKLVVVNESV